MSDFAALERSLEGSRPAELYTFTLGTSVYRYTSAEDSITFGADTFTPLAIGRGSLAQGPDDRTKTMDLTLPLANEFAQRYLNIPPGLRAGVTIQRIQRDAVPMTSLLVFKGFVRSVQFPDSATAEVSCLSLEASSSRPVPRHVYQGLCNHFLYDLGCAVDPAPHTLAAFVSAVVGNVVTVAGAGTFGGLKAGFVRLSGGADFRLILSQSGDDLTLLLPFPTSVAGQAVDCVRGCNHLLDGDCRDRFANTPRFAGYAFSPTKNPFSTGLD